MPATESFPGYACRHPADRIAGFSASALHLIVLIIALVGLSLQLQAFPNHDVSWILWGTREMLHGAEWGRDIIEPNPPLAWYLAMPSTWIADGLGLSIAAAFLAAVSIAAIISVVSFDAITRRGQARGSWQGYLPGVIAAIFLLILPDRDFGQREHLTLIAVLPYLGLVAARLDGRTVSTWAAFAIGVAAGLGLALKPYFLAVPLFVEIVAMLLLRRWSAPLRAETIGIAVVVLAYGASILLLGQLYLTEVVPLARAIYWSFDVPGIAVLLPIAFPVLVAALAGAAAVKARLRLPLILATATAGFAMSCILQHKGYSYHVFPVWAGAAVTVAAFLASSTVRVREHICWSALLSILLIQGGVETVRWWHVNGPNGSLAAENRALIAAVDRHAGDGRFLTVAVHPYPAFPTALYVRSDQVSRTNSQWFLPAVVQLRSAPAGPHSDALQFAERKAREFILRDLGKAPNVVIIGTNSRRHTTSIADFDFLKFYLEDPSFQVAWSAYREIAPVNAFRLFVRKGASGQ